MENHTVRNWTDTISITDKIYDLNSLGEEAVNRIMIDINKKIVEQFSKPKTTIVNPLYNISKKKIIVIHKSITENEQSNESDGTDKSNESNDQKSGYTDLINLKNNNNHIDIDRTVSEEEEITSITL